MANPENFSLRASGGIASVEMQLVPAGRNILVLRFSAVGDIILTFPAVHALKTAWPDARIIYATRAAMLPLVENNPHLDDTVGLEPGEGTFAFASRLRAMRPDIVLDLHGKIRARALSVLVGGKRVVRWRKRRWQDTLPVKLRLRPYRADMLLSDRSHRAVEELVGTPLPRGELRYFIGPEHERQAAEVFAAARVPADRKLVGMSPGANWETKRWPVERYRDLAARVLSTGAKVILTGSAAERELCASIASLGEGVFDLSGKLDLRGLGGAIARCDAFVANDSGPMHMARGLGVPTLAFFGSTDAGQFEFTGHAALASSDVACAPCSFYGLPRCPRGHFDCMRSIDVERAWSALQPLIGRGRLPLLHA